MPVNHQQDDLQKQQSFRFGLMLNSLMVEHWQYLCIEKLIRDGNRAALLILNDNIPQKPSFLNKLSTYPWEKLLYNLYNRYLLRPKAKKRVSIHPLIEECETIRCRTKQTKHTDSFSDKDIERIKDHQPDFILRFGFNILKGEILQAAKYGIWSFHHDDEKKYRGGPPAFWEIYKNNPVNGVILQQLTEKLDAGVILKKGYFKTVFHSYSANIDQAYYESTSWPVLLCNEIRSGIFRPWPGQSEAPVYHVPSNFRFIGFCCKLILNKLRFHLKELFKVEDWNIAMAETHISDDGQIQLKDAVWHPKSSAKRFLADPFIFEHKNKTFILAEDYRYPERKGRISMGSYDPAKRSFSEFQAVISEDFHLAYPSVFRYKDQIYCIPETFEKNQIRLYRFDKEKETFIFDRVLLDGIDAVDPTLLEQDGRFYLFFTKRRLPSVHLYIYHAENFEGPYLPHASNPVKTDIRSARPGGGFFRMNGQLYRPAQDCAETYGKRILINQVQKLSPLEYEEITVSGIKALQGTKFDGGLHTFNFTGDLAVIDGKRFAFLVQNLWYQLGRKFKRLLHLNPEQQSHAD